MSSGLPDIMMKARPTWLCAGCKAQEPESELLKNMQATMRKYPDVETAIADFKNSRGHGL